MPNEFLFIKTQVLPTVGVNVAKVEPSELEILIGYKLDISVIFIV